VSLFYTFHFYLFGLIAIASAVAFVTRKSPVAAALWLVNTMFSLAALYVMLGAQFVGAIQVLVYAGAIMVVFLFVVMLLNLGDAKELDIKGRPAQLAAGLVGLALLAQLFALSRHGVAEPQAEPAMQVNVTADIAQSLFIDHVVAFQVTAILLLAAIVGAVVLAKRRV
jgi:NADH-quinone oxidoreductase subunit J